MDAVKEELKYKIQELRRKAHHDATQAAGLRHLADEMEATSRKHSGAADQFQSVLALIGGDHVETQFYEQRPSGVAWEIRQKLEKPEPAKERDEGIVVRLGGTIDPQSAAREIQRMLSGNNRRPR